MRRLPNFEKCTEAKKVSIAERRRNIMDLETLLLWSVHGVNKLDHRFAMDVNVSWGCFSMNRGKADVCKASVAEGGGEESA